MSRPLTADELDQIPVGRCAIDDNDRMWLHVRESGAPWDDVTPAWEPIGKITSDEAWLMPSAASNTLQLVLARGPFSHQCQYSDCLQRAAIRLFFVDRPESRDVVEVHCNTHARMMYYEDAPGEIYLMTGM